MLSAAGSARRLGPCLPREQRRSPPRRAPGSSAGAGALAGPGAAAAGLPRGLDRRGCPSGLRQVFRNVRDAGHCRGFVLYGKQEFISTLVNVGKGLRFVGFLLVCFFFFPILLYC